MKSQVCSFIPPAPAGNRDEQSKTRLRTHRQGPRASHIPCYRPRSGYVPGRSQQMDAGPGAAIRSTLPGFRDLHPVRRTGDIRVDLLMRDRHGPFCPKPQTGPVRASRLTQQLPDRSPGIFPNSCFGDRSRQSKGPAGGGSPVSRGSLWVHGCWRMDEHPR